MEAYRFRWYTFLLVLDLCWIGGKVTRCLHTDIHMFYFFGVVVSCSLQKDIIIESISFRKQQQREGHSTARIITLIYGCIWSISTLQTAVTGSLSAILLAPNKGKFRAILCKIACGCALAFFSAVTITLAIVTCTFIYRLSWKKALFRKVNIEWSSFTSLRRTLTFYLSHAN